MSSSSQEESAPNDQSNNEGKLTATTDAIAEALARNVDTGTSPCPPDEEYQYEEYEIEEYEEEEEDGKEGNSNGKSKTNNYAQKSPNKGSPTSTKSGKTSTRSSPNKDTFMTQNTALYDSQTSTSSSRSPSRSSPNSNGKGSTFGKSNNRNYSKSKVPPLNKSYNLGQQSNDADKALDLLIRDGVIPSSDCREPVLNAINRKKIEALFHADYESAEVYENAAQTILNSEVESALANRDSHQQKLRENRNHILKKKLKDTEEKYQKKIQSNSEECERRLEEAERLQQEEIEQFKENWKNPEYIKQYCKPSAKMLQLRYVEKKLALTKRYSDAVMQRKIGDRQQQIEQENIQKNLEIQMKTDFTKMRERHKAEIERIEFHYDQMNSGLEARMKRELASIQFAMKQNSEIRQPDVMRQKWRMASTGQLKSPQTSLPTPRTKQKLDKFKNERNVQIVVNPFDDSQLGKLPVSSFRSAKRQGIGLSTARSRSSMGSRSRFPNLNHS